MESFISERRELKERQQEKYKYEVPASQGRTTKSLEIIQFVPFEETTRMTQQEEENLETNEVVNEDKGAIRLGSRVAAGGSKPKLGFRTPAQGE